jgi:hypothetical protein
MDTQRGALILADISGYTHFTRMHFTSLLHAEEIISELLEAVIAAAEFPLRVTQLEGDAVLLVAEVAAGREADACHDVAQQVQRLFAAFLARERALIDCEAGCACDACNQIGNLKLKAVLHFGEYTLQHIRDLEELTGPAVKLLRTLIKAPVDAREYILMTDRFYTLSGGLTGHIPDQQLTLDEPVVIYFPRITITRVQVLPGSGPAFSLRLNQHAFARMFRRKPRATFENLISGRLNLIVYLFEGLHSAFNLIRRSFRRDRSKAVITVKPVALVMLQIDQPPHTATPDPIVRQLLNALIDAAQPPLILNKLEGDAALLYAVAQDAALIASTVAQQVENFYAAFKRTVQVLAENPNIPTEIRQTIPALRCKILLHFGEAAVKTIRHFDEIAGEDVILIHRLLKSAIGFPAYALMTDRFYQLTGGLPHRTAEPHIETVEDFGAMRVWVYSFAQVN